MSQISGQTDNHKVEGILIPSSQWGNEICADVELIKENLLEIKKRIAHCKPKIIGVTKYFGLNAMLNGYKAGVLHFGESRASDAISKIESLPREVREGAKFHFIGHLQTNKADKVVEYFDYIHSVDSLKLAKVISKAACRFKKREKILLQVNVAAEEQKFGYTKEQLLLDLKEIIELQFLDVIGLMCMAPLGADEAKLRKIFGSLREFRDELERKFSISLPELSMGMSDDYHIAIEEGSTMVRIGRKLFK